MFDIGFSEMLVIAVVALIVIGPERLPKVARTLGHLFGRMQRYVNDVKADISREMELDELRKLQTQIQDAAQSFETSVKSGMSATESELQQIAQEVNPVALASGALSTSRRASRSRKCRRRIPLRVRSRRPRCTQRVRSRQPRCTKRVRSRRPRRMQRGSSRWPGCTHRISHRVRR